MARCRALLAVEKPAGMTTHPSKGERSGTLVNALLHHVRQASATPHLPEGLFAEDGESAALALGEDYAKAVARGTEV